MKIKIIKLMNLIFFKNTIFNKLINLIITKILKNIKFNKACLQEAYKVIFKEKNTFLKQNKQMTLLFTVIIKFKYKII